MAEEEVSEKALSWKAVLAATIPLIISGVVIYWLTVGIGGGSSDQSPVTTTKLPETHRFTVEDAENHGTWGLAHPNATRLRPRNERPSDAAEWLPESTPVTISCAAIGSAYAVVNEGRRETWRWWARLTSGRWIAMAALHQATVDGSQGFKTC
jgi:hypothetical protein